MYWGAWRNFYNDSPVVFGATPIEPAIQSAALTQGPLLQARRHPLQTQFEVMKQKAQSNPKVSDAVVLNQFAHILDSASMSIQAAELRLIASQLQKQPQKNPSLHHRRQPRFSTPVAWGPNGYAPLYGTILYGMTSARYAFNAPNGTPLQVVQSYPEGYSRVALVDPSPRKLGNIQVFVDTKFIRFP